MADFPDCAPAPIVELPDVVSEQATQQRGALDWVGMEQIESLVRWSDPESNVPCLLPARVLAQVDLPGTEHRGIHMSRLYRALDQHVSEHGVAPGELRRLLQDFLDSHVGVSARARVVFRFELPLRRRALSSGLQGWRLYPVEIAAHLGPGGFSADCRVEVLYSSTCPGSAALARQLVQQDFDSAFPHAAPTREQVRGWLASVDGMRATPHAQRSLATVRVRWNQHLDPAPVSELIDRIESALATPVQTAVKRGDEQAFARLNGENAMYCEDAVRRIRTALEDMGAIEDYAIRAAHLESLHPHDAVAEAVRGVAGGFTSTQ